MSSLWDDYACQYPDAVALYFLAGYTANMLTHWDGPHDSPAEVAEALELWRRLRFSYGPDFWKMISIEDVPALEHQPTFNEEAIASCNEMLARQRRE